MNRSELIQREIDEMCRHKWIESEKAGRDLGERACCEWAEKHAKALLDELMGQRDQQTSPSPTVSVNA